MKGLKVIQPGIHSLIQDAGRHGFHSIGITSGGALDSHSFHCANQLCDNSHTAACIEILVGGLILEAQIATQIAITGAQVPISINNRSVSTWCNHAIQPGDRIKIGYASGGCRAYLSVAGGIQTKPIFGSVSTVVREGLGGLHGDGKPLQQGDILPCQPSADTQQRSTPLQQRPVFTDCIAEIRMLLGYQHSHFNQSQLDLLFNSEYTVSKNSDRMGYRLEGPAIIPPYSEMLSEGICLGALQLPTDGQPIILLSDRQTIGGYPKIGSVLSLDINKLAQLMPGRKLRFVPISLEQAQIALRNPE